MRSSLCKLSLLLFIGVCFADISSAQNTDSLDLKIGQMVMIGINNMKALDHSDPLYAELQEGKAGGIILFEKNISKTNSREQLKTLIDSLQKAGKTKLLIAIDEEGGKVHRLKEKYGFPAMVSAAYLGALDNEDSTLYYNRALAKEMSALGINLNFAPDVDVAVNPANPVIVKNDRSFSADPAIVTRHAMWCIQAHRAYGVKTVLKHFPGHGSSTRDSHKGIVDVSGSWSMVELMPFYNLIKTNSCDAIMTAHIINTQWDTTALPATLSEQVISGLLRKILGFKGVVFSDDMQMHAISKNYGFRNAIKMSVNAGVDILVFGNNVTANESITATEVHSIIKDLVAKGAISRERIDEAYNRIQAFKSDQQ